MINHLYKQLLPLWKQELQLLNSFLLQAFNSDLGIYQKQGVNFCKRDNSNEVYIRSQKGKDGKALEKASSVVNCANKQMSGRP